MMISFFKCVIYLVLIGFAAFALGRIVPKSWFCPDRFPFSSTQPKRENDLYVALGVRKWKDKCPDMSVILPGVMPSKKLPEAITAEKISLMVKETCIAEWIHGLLAILSFACVFIWKSLGGWIISVLASLANLAYVIIQRHNRPKLLRLLARFKEIEAATAAKVQEVFYESGSTVELQHGTRT